MLKFIKDGICWNLNQLKFATTGFMLGQLDWSSTYAVWLKLVTHTEDRGYDSLEYRRNALSIWFMSGPQLDTDKEWNMFD